MNTTRHSVVMIGAQQEEGTIYRQIEEVAEVLASEPDPAKALEHIRNKTPTITLLFLDHDPDAILALVKQISQEGKSIPIVVTNSQDPSNILLAMRAGARDVAFLQEEDGDLRRAIHGIGLIRVVENTPESDRCKVISFFSAKGGSGSTTIALNLAGSLLSYGLDKGELHRKVAVLDYDMEMGDVLIFLDIESRYSYQDVIRNKHRLDADLLYRSVARHSSGLSVLSQTDRVEVADEIDVEEMNEVLTFLKEHYDFIVIDGLRDFRDMSLMALDNADTIILTMTQDIPALKNADRCLKIFKRLGYTNEKTKLVLNRYRNSSQLNTDAISDALGREIDGTVTNDFPTVIKAINQGLLLVNTSPNSRVAKNLFGLAKLFCEDAEARKPKRFSFWGRK